MDIKGRRVELGISQESLAHALGVTQQAVTKWETGAALPRADKLLALARELNCTIEELLSENKL